MVKFKLFSEFRMVSPLTPELILLAGNGVGAVSDDGFSADQPGDQETVTGKSDGIDSSLKGCHA
jgi:hypothetical protein